MNYRLLKTHEVIKTGDELNVRYSLGFRHTEWSLAIRSLGHTIPEFIKSNTLVSERLVARRTI